MLNSGSNSANRYDESAFYVAVIFWIDIVLDFNVLLKSKLFPDFFVLESVAIKTGNMKRA